MQIMVKLKKMWLTFSAELKGIIRSYKCCLLITMTVNQKRHQIIYVRIYPAGVLVT